MSVYGDTVLDLIRNNSLTETDLALIAGAIKERTEDDDEEPEEDPGITTGNDILQLVETHQIANGHCLQDMALISSFEEYGRHLVAAFVFGDFVAQVPPGLKNPKRWGNEEIR